MWRNGLRSRLKIYRLRAYQFESGHRYKIFDILNVSNILKNYESEGELVYPGGGIIVGSSNKLDTKVVTLP